MKDIRLRKLALKSVLDFGKHQGRTVQQIIDLGDFQYLIWCYYNFDKISFLDEILDDVLHIPKKFRIHKPGKNPDMFEDNRHKIRKAYFRYAERSKGQGYAGRVEKQSQNEVKKRNYWSSNNKYSDVERNRGH